MDSGFHGVPLSAIKMAPKAAVAAPPYNISSSSSGIRAPLTVDESDFEYSASSKSHRNSITSSYYSGSEVESEGSVSGEDEFEPASERPFKTYQDEEILEETHFVEEYAFSKPSAIKTNEEVVQESSNSDGHGFSRPSVKIPNEAFAQESGNVGGNAFLRPFVRNLNERIYRGISDVNGSVDSRLFLNESGDELVEDEDYVLEKGNNRPLLAVRDEDVSEYEKILLEDIKIPLVQKLRIPIAQISWDSDEDSQASEALEDEVVSGIVRIPSIEVLHRVNSAPKVRMLESDEEDDNESQAENMVEMEFDEDLVISNGVLGLENEKEPVYVEDTIHHAVSADMIQYKGPDVNEEARASSLFVNEGCDSMSDSEQNGALMHLSEEIQEVDMMDLVDHEEPIDLAVGTAFPGNTSSVASAAEPGCPCGNVELVEPEVAEFRGSSNFGAASLDDGDGKSSNAGLEDKRVFNQVVESEKLESESEQEIDWTVESFSSIATHKSRSVYQCVDIKEVPSEACPQFQELPEALTEGVQVDVTDSLLKDVSLTGVSNACQSVFEGTKLEEETKKEAKNSEQLPVEVECSTFQTDTKMMVAEIEREQDSASLSGGEILKDHSEEIDGQIVTDLDEGLDADHEISDRRQIIDSAALDAFLKVVRGAVSDDDAVKFTSVDGIENYSLESDLAGPGSIFHSTRPIIEARNPALFVPSSTNGELEEPLSEREKNKLEKIKQIQVKCLLLLHRLGCSPEDSVASEVLNLLTIAEARPSSRAFHFDSFKKAAMELETQAKDDLDFSLCILVIGKTGVGKSATINSIFGERKTVIDAFEPATMHVKEIIGMINGVKVKVFDTPGLRTSVKDHSINRKVLSSIRKLMQKSSPDVILYVDRLDTQTSNLNDLPLLKLVSSYLGSSIWQKSIIALTHATSMPPDGPNGHPLSYEVFVAQQSRAVQQLISHSAGEFLVMNPGLMFPVSLVENHPFAKKNGHGETLLQNGESWRSQLLFLCYSMKILSEVNSVVTIKNPLNYQKLFGLQIRSPPLSYFLSSLLQPNVHPKLSNGLFGESVDSDVELRYSSDSDLEEESEYDNLPPFRPLKKSQIAKLSRDQRKAYFEEYDYRLKLLQKKQLKEEMRMFRDLRKVENSAADETYMEEVVDQEIRSPETVAVPLPDMALPPSFDGDNPSLRYHFLEPSSQHLTMPVFDSHGWDHDCGCDSVLMEDKINIASHFPALISVQLAKDKKEFNIQLHSSVSAKHGDNRSTMAGLDIQTFGEKLTYILMGETKIKNFRNNKTAAGISITFLGENVMSGLKIEDHIAIGKRLVLVGNAGVVQSQDDVAYGVNLDLCSRDKDYPIDQPKTSMGLSVISYRGDLICGCNLQSNFAIGRNSKLNVAAGLNSKLSGQISINTNCSDQLQIAALAFLPIARAIFKKIFPQSAEVYSA